MNKYLEKKRLEVIKSEGFIPHSKKIRNQGGYFKMQKPQSTYVLVTDNKDRVIVDLTYYKLDGLMEITINCAAFMPEEFLNNSEKGKAMRDSLLPSIKAGIEMACEYYVAD